MGWFWAETKAPKAHHDSRRSGDSPPPGCPMHAASIPAAQVPKNAMTPASDSSCPYTPPDSRSPASEPVAGSSLSRLNPLNYMPSNLSQEQAPAQKVKLPTERELSSIPKGAAEDEGVWVYPSPQQMYNALKRKGYDDTDETAIESMVSVHNFLNEGAWGEIVEWERRFSPGLKAGWEACTRGEYGSMAGATLGANREAVTQPRLLRFMGRPKEMTPKASMLQVMGWMYPSKFGTEPPFDRHDWFVQRQTPGGQPREVRYVIDYYSGPPEPTGEPVFYLDVRPAVDRPSAAIERMMRWGGDVWWRASGGVARENPTSYNQL